VSWDKPNIINPIKGAKNPRKTTTGIIFAARDKPLEALFNDISASFFIKKFP
jgi:hypothetical protein